MFEQLAEADEHDRARASATEHHRNTPYSDFKGIDQRPIDAISIEHEGRVITLTPAQWHEAFLLIAADERYRCPPTVKQPDAS